MENSKSGNISSCGKIGKYMLPDYTGEKSDSFNSYETQILLRVKKMEQVNVQLEKLVEERTNKLAEVIATNAKFLSLLAHDLRSPFQSIVSALDLLQECYNDNDAAQIESYINMANNSVNTSLRLLENLLSWTSMQHKEKNFNPVNIDLYEVILGEIENSNISATQKQITLNHSITPGLYATADLQMVKTILRNLINNAIKYSYLGGEITVSAIEKDNSIEFEIKDNGVGISRDGQRNLFKHNALYSTIGTKNEHGTGLGLMICKEFVEMHGGIIWVESEPGKGTKIRFTLRHHI